jgi:hypothetical protein
MSIAALTSPLQAAFPVLQTLAATVRPLLGVGFLAILSVVAVLFTLFRPLMMGVIHAAMLVIKPRLSFEERAIRSKVRGVMMLNRMANQYDRLQPNLASELRNLAARD